VQKQSASSRNLGLADRSIRPISRAGLATLFPESCFARVLRISYWRPQDLQFRVCAQRNMQERSRTGRAAPNSKKCAPPQHRPRESPSLFRRKLPLQTDWRIRLEVEFWNYRSPAIFSPFEGWSEGCCHLMMIGEVLTVTIAFAQHGHATPEERAHEYYLAL
jgi:hypothetical protein